MTSNRLRATVLGATLTLSLCFGTALASRPSIAIGTLGVASGTLSQFLVAPIVGGTAGLCYQTATTRPSYACFERAVTVSGLASLIEGNGPVTVLAPTDEAFAHLADTVGTGTVRAFLSNPSTTAAFVRSSLVSGTNSLSDIAAAAEPTSPSITVTTIDGTTLAVTFGGVGYSTHSTDVSIGSKDAVDGQSYVVAPPTRFSNGDVLIPLGRLTLLSLDE